MRAIGVHEDVIVVTSRCWQTNCTIVRGPAQQADSEPEAFVIDSPIFPDELELLPALMEQADFTFAGLLVTHADWDHLLGRLAFPGAAIGCAETTAARLAASPGAAARELRDFDQRHYVVRPQPLSIGEAQGLPVPGHCAIGSAELELHPADGHTVDGMAIWIGWARVLVCGDYLSPVEIPMLAPDASLDAYLATLRRLAPLVQDADSVVPGHGAVLARGRALSLLEEDLAYLEGLRSGDAPLPPGRNDAQQRRVHAANLRLVG